MRHKTLTLALAAALCAFFTPSGSAQRTRKPKSHCSVTSAADCPRDGCGADMKLSHAKNRLDPAQGQNPERMTVGDVVDLNEESPTHWTMNAPRTEVENLGEGSPVTVTGYLIHARVSHTPEACNCNLSGDENNDFHLNIVERKNDGMADSVVVEMTPNYRHKVMHDRWSIDELQGLAEETTYVKVTGWLLFDSAHPGQNGSSRATPWEVHPVTKFEVCTKTKKQCDQGTGWKLLETE